MPLTGPALGALVFADHLALFPSAAGANRANPATGVPLHNVPEEFINALCAAFAAALPTMVVKDIGAGVLGVPPGVSPPVPIVFPGIPGAVAAFVASQGWVGSMSALAAQSFVGNVLLNTSKIALLQMKPNPLMASGVGVVSPASNPDLFSAMQAALLSTLPAAFQASGFFGEGDVPGAPVNKTLARQLPAYATALATGTASLVASVPYAGSAVPATPVAGAINTGTIS